jgi:23S rRNA (cytosine1962-C5)-methyltransferase
MSTFLQDAVSWREKWGYLNNTDCVRIFYGPGETKDAFLKHIAVDLFGDYVWITQWENVPEKTIEHIRQALQSLRVRGKPLLGASWMDRSKVASNADAVSFWGTVPTGRLTLSEGPARYSIQLLNTKHPGLFLDHFPLRDWLHKTQSKTRVLNLFAYTGSLSVAAGLGGASHVTTLDLSKPTIDWAKENWGLNLGEGPTSDFIFGDVFEWLPKLIKRGEKFDTVLCDPPSFSRTKSRTFSTQKDLTALHELVFQLLAPGGILVTSINSENVSEGAFLREIDLAAKLTRTPYQILARVDLPATFPTQDSGLRDRYLKGFYLRSNLV